MPTIPFKQAVVKELNKINGVAIAVSDVLVGSFTASKSDPKTGTAMLFANPAGTISDAGRTTVQYQRLPLQMIAAYWPSPLVVRQAPTVRELIPALARATGVRFTEKDLQDQALDFSTGDISVVLYAQPNSNLCVGSVRVTLRAAPLVNLASVWTNPVLQRQGLLNDVSDLIALANTTNQRFVDKQCVSWGALQDTDDPRGNSVVRFTGKPAYGFTTDVVDLYFNRDSIADILPKLFIYSTQAYTGTTRQFIQTYFPQILNKIILTNIVDDFVQYGSTGQDVEVPIKVIPGSLNLTGTINASVLWQSGTDFVSFRSSFMQYASREPSAASVAGVRGKALIQQYYPVSVRSANIQYAVQDRTASSVAAVRGKALVQQYYGISMRTAFMQYAVSES